jgi:hypothetical protein
LEIYMTNSHPLAADAALALQGVADLIARLRKDVYYGDERLHNMARHNPLHAEAIAALTALSAQVAELTAERDRAVDLAKRAGDLMKQADDRRLAAEAKAARLEGARVISADTHCSCGNTGPCMWSDCKHPWAETPEGSPE